MSLTDSTHPTTPVRVKLQPSPHHTDEEHRMTAKLVISFFVILQATKEILVEFFFSNFVSLNMTNVGKISVQVGPENSGCGTSAANKQSLEKAMCFTTGQEEETAMSSFISGV